MVLRQQCPFCGEKNVNNKMFLQRDFSMCRNITLFEKYDVFRCSNCNLYYAGNIVQIKEIADYYNRMSRYESGNYTLSKDILRHYKKNVDIIQKVISKEARILDVGCAFGGLLNELKKEGYTHLLGLEPSEKNCHYAKEVYDITVLEGNWGNEMPISEEKFDLIIFSAVLEHLLDFKSDIQRCKKYLNNDGYLYIVLPDVELYSEQDDLYQEFSSEHINYFDIDFLNLMMVENGYVLVEFERDYIGAMGISGSFCSLWKSTNGSFDKENISSAILVENLHESTVEEKFELYLKQCHKVMVQMNKKIRDFKFDDGYYIWGAGTSAAMMAQLGIIKYPEIKGVIDSNLNYKGQEAFGCQIVQPKDLKNMKNRPILVTSQYAFHEINQYLIREGISNKVINLYT